MSRGALLSETEGSVMTLALFMALFLVAAMYYVLGVGDAILYRRAMQDAVDGGAQAAAVLGAKGMNLHALLNVVMAITAGILLVIRSIEIMLEIILSVLAGLASTLVFSIKAAALIAVLAPVERSVERIGDGVEEFVTIAHDALDVAHEAVQRGFPLLAEARAIEAIAFEEVHDPPVVAGFIVPLLGPRLPDGGAGLPVEKADVGLTCDRVAQGLGNRLADAPSKVPRWLLRFLGGLVERSLRLGKRRTCDDDIVEAPRVVVESRADGSEVWLGQEEFQYRAYGFGDDPRVGHWGRGERGIRIAQGGAEARRDAFARAQVVGRIAFAQAEYYFDGSEPKAEWSWKQRWRARLRRYRIDRGWAPAGIGSACSAAGGVRSGGQLGQLCESIRDFALNMPSAH